MNAIDRVEAQQTKTQLPQLTPGDTVRVHVRVKETSIKEDPRAGKIKVKETERERVQVFEGLIIALRGTGARRMVTVRKVSGGEGVERIFPVNSPTVEKIEVVRRAHVRRAKLYYLRELKGRAGRMRERREDGRE
jgi:large subunit ribosomal protein L19